MPFPSSRDTSGLPARAPGSANPLEKHRWESGTGEEACYEAPLSTAAGGSGGRTPRGGRVPASRALAGTRPATISHVMLIVFENKSYGAVVGKASAPYLNGTLITGCGLATN